MIDITDDDEMMWLLWQLFFYLTTQKNLPDKPEFWLILTNFYL